MLLTQLNDLSCSSHRFSDWVTVSPLCAAVLFSSGQKTHKVINAYLSFIPAITAPNYVGSDFDSLADENKGI